MKNRELIILSTTLAIVCAISPLASLTNPGLANPTSATTKTVTAAKPKAGTAAVGKVAKKKTAEEIASEECAAIAKLEAIKQKNVDIINSAAQADMAVSNYAAAEKKLLEALDLAENLNSNEQKLLTRTCLADCYLKQKKYKEAERHYLEAYDNNINYYRGIYPVLLDDAKGLSEVYKATGRVKEAEEILASATEARKARYCVAGVADGDLFATFYQSMREAVAKKNPVAVGKMIQYPLAVRWNGNIRSGRNSRTYRNSKELLANYNTIFTPEIAKLFAEIQEKDLWCRDQGIMLGGGLVWLTNVHLVNVAGKPTYQLNGMVINDDMPKK